ncbi:MAG: DUF2971 domain-containing protein [Castellaniella sp.]|uniref:DUF2971 domain-containing protein n=1 Tax=Castellaniella sp. TaxID=1955812 RepID=UPI0012015231|nr:DUF2971 domain-containing protein [Castellaniella sp.]TAN25028.1 MAG: DUF2971 domain-containing protein [Castellaniella sp.]
MARTAWERGHRVLYHWQRFDIAPDLKHAERLATFLRTRQLYCSSPGAFNDPWDCRPWFNTAVLQDAGERQRHANWALEVCNRQKPMPPEANERMRTTLLDDPKKAKELLNQIAQSLAPVIDARYRIYCLGPDPTNVLMWSHYAGDHQGICLEYSLRNEVMCCALECEYVSEFPLLLPYDSADSAEFRTLLAKSKIWHYENEFRLVAQERSQAVEHTDTLMTDDGFLQLPDGALTAVIVGCQGAYDVVKRIVEQNAPAVQVKHAMRVPDRYQIFIEG